MIYVSYVSVNVKGHRIQFVCVGRFRKAAFCVGCELQDKIYLHMHHGLIVESASRSASSVSFMDLGPCAASKCWRYSRI